MTLPEDFKQRSRAHWEEQAAGWGRRADALARASVPVSMWMVEALEPQPGHDVLELAAGPGDTGFLAAELIAPTGTLTCSDFSPQMLNVARDRATAQGITNVRFRQLDAEVLDVEAASLDGVLCRWGYMLLASPESALRETRRVLRPGGRVALAAWTGPEENPWSAQVNAVLRELGHLAAPAPGEPGQFAWAAGEAILVPLLEDAGFADLVVDRVAFELHYPDLDAYLVGQRDFSNAFSSAWAGLDGAQREQVTAAIAERTAPCTGADGSIVLPAATWVAAATA